MELKDGFGPKDVSLLRWSDSGVDDDNATTAVVRIATGRVFVAITARTDDETFPRSEGYGRCRRVRRDRDEASAQVAGTAQAVDAVAHVQRVLGIRAAGRGRRRADVLLLGKPTSRASCVRPRNVW